MDRHLALVMTDDAQSIRVLEQALPPFGLQVLVLRDGPEAVARLDELEPGLAVLDLRLASSFDILTHPHLALCKVIILTPDVVCVHLTGRQADAELLQPISAQDVTAVLRQMPAFAKSP